MFKLAYKILYKQPLLLSLPSIIHQDSCFLVILHVGATALLLLILHFSMFPASLLKQ